MTDLSRIRARLEALRNMTVDNGCTEAEALAAASKMADLLARHGLTEEQLEALGYDRNGVVLGSRRSPLEQVWTAVAVFTDCICWLQRGDGLAMVYFGRPQDVLVAQYVHEVLHRAFKADLSRFKVGDQYRRRRLPKTRSAAVKAYTEGWADQVALKLYDGLWRRNGGTWKEAQARIDSRTAELETAAAQHQGVRLSPCRALAKPKAGDTKHDRHAGAAAGRHVEVNAGLASGPVAGLLE